MSHLRRTTLRPLQAHQAQRGAAILTAMLTVVLVASLAASALWQQWRGIEIEAAERSRTQSSWVLTGALDWARLILREDARKGGADHLAEPWAIPLAQARLSTFLAADRSDTLPAEEAQDAFLSGQMQDLQARLNITNLVLDGKTHEPTELAFQRLFKHLKLPARELTLLTEQIALAQGNSADLKPRPNAPLLPQTIEQLTWLGLSPRSLAVLRPFITLLPVRTPVNLNTAPLEVVFACVPTFELADAHRLVASRSEAHFSSLSAAARASGQPNTQLNDAQHSINSRYFEILGKLQIERTTVQEKSMVQRDGLDVKTLLRSRGVFNLSPLQ
jgi:general secretion pathway protein K